MRLSREKIVQISHVAVEAVASLDDVEFVEDRNTIRLEIVKIVTDLLKQEEQIEAAARQKIESQKKDIPEGSNEWDTLYRKYYADEMARYGVIPATTS
jgi:hypothetical protein